MNRSANRLGTALGIMILLSLPATSQPATSPPSNTPVPEFQLGMAAAQSGDWNNALQHFAEANKTAPDNSYVLYNLGLANEKLGRGTAAVCWYQAALLTDPPLPNKSDISTEIELLSSTAVRKLAEAVDSANELSENSSTAEQSDAFALAAQLNAATGNIHKALNYCQKVDVSQQSAIERSCRQLYFRYAQQMDDPSALEQAKKWLDEHNSTASIASDINTSDNFATELSKLDGERSAAARRKAFSELWQHQAKTTDDAATRNHSEEALSQLAQAIVSMSDRANGVRLISKNYQSDSGAAQTYAKLHSQSFSRAALVAVAAPQSQGNVSTQATATSPQHLSALAPLPKQFKVNVHTRNNRYHFRQHFRGKAVWDHDNVYNIDWGLPAMPGIGRPWRAYVTGDYVQLVEDRFSLRGAQTVLTGTILGRRASGNLHGQDLFTSWNGNWEAWW